MHSHFVVHKLSVRPGVYIEVIVDVAFICRCLDVARVDSEENVVYSRAQSYSCSIDTLTEGLNKCDVFAGATSVTLCCVDVFGEGGCHLLHP